MKLYDITKEVFHAEVYPGDPEPYWRKVMTLDGEEPDNCQLSEIFLGSHTGTHLDAPRHFLKDGKDVSRMDLTRCIGACKVVKAVPRNEIERENGREITGEMMEEFLADEPERLLIKGKAIVTEDAARLLVEQGVVCIGVEEITVGPISAPDRVHRILLEKEVVILESLNLQEVPVGNYKLTALPLKMEGLDGSPVRAVLTSDDVSL